MGRRRPYYVYIIQCKNKSFYTGQTHDLHNRIKEHSGLINPHRASRYVIRSGFDHLAYYEIMSNRSSALARENEIQKWGTDYNLRRRYKEYLTTNMPQWKLQCFHDTRHWSALIAKYHDAIRSGYADFKPLSPADWLRDGTINAERRSVSAHIHRASNQTAKDTAPRGIQQQSQHGCLSTMLVITVICVAINILTC